MRREQFEQFVLYFSGATVGLDAQGGPFGGETDAELVEKKHYIATVGRFFCCPIRSRRFRRRFCCLIEGREN